jgi:hypothetical protein
MPYLFGIPDDGIGQEQEIIFNRGFEFFDLINQLERFLVKSCFTAFSGKIIK